MNPKSPRHIMHEQMMLTKMFDEIPSGTTASDIVREMEEAKFSEQDLLHEVNKHDFPHESNNQDSTEKAFKLLYTLNSVNVSEMEASTKLTLIQQQMMFDSELIGMTFKALNT
ncbi:hypothetical protein O6P43_032316 [Quillaja saponaria]|uniref:Uncharacterized protein n=1 Tax=Quillaja saponaria TaxID=32244 RepID=A0AAD7KMS1_QUISA|nr:hypothetical protein O6P43_032316 [Quillaja saponaria]